MTIHRVSYTFEPTVRAEAEHERRHAEVRLEVVAAPHGSGSSNYLLFGGRRKVVSHADSEPSVVAAIVSFRSILQTAAARHAG
jgi:hypothetical protein